MMNMGSFAGLAASIFVVAGLILTLAWVVPLPSLWRPGLWVGAAGIPFAFFAIYLKRQGWE